MAGLNVKVGTVYECPELRCGEGQRGAWAFFRVKAKKGYDSLNVWASNPANINGATAVKVISIDNVELKSRLDERSQKWYKDYNVTCTLERAESGRQGAGSGFVDTEEDINKLFGLA